MTDLPNIPVVSGDSSRKCDRISLRLRAIVDIHTHESKDQRIAHHWVGMTPFVQYMALPSGVARVITVAIPDYLKASGLVIHGVLGEDGDAPQHETIQTAAGSVRAPKNARYFLEDRETSEQIIMEVDKGMMDDYSVGVYANDANRWLNGLKEFAIKNNHLRGQIFNLSGEMIKPQEEGMDDMILTPEQERSIRIHILNFPDVVEKMKKIGGRRQRGVILEGVPGCGKSKLIGAIAKHLKGVSVCMVSPNEISGSNGVEGLRQLIEITRPVAICLEELDIFGMDRSLRHSPQAAELMQIMDGARNIPDVLWIATTNRPEEVEKALADRPGRFDRRIKFGQA